MQPLKITGTVEAEYHENGDGVARYALDLTVTPVESPNPGTVIGPISRTHAKPFVVDTEPTPAAAPAADAGEAMEALRRAHLIFLQRDLTPQDKENFGAQVDAIRDALARANPVSEAAIERWAARLAYRLWNLKTFDEFPGHTWPQAVAKVVTAAARDLLARDAKE